MHPNQLYSLQNLVQHRLSSGSEPLVEVYRILRMSSLLLSSLDSVHANSVHRSLLREHAVVAATLPAGVFK